MWFKYMYKSKIHANLQTESCARNSTINPSLVFSCISPTENFGCISPASLKFAEQFFCFPYSGTPCRVATFMQDHESQTKGMHIIDGHMKHTEENMAFRVVHFKCSSLSRRHLVCH